MTAISRPPCVALTTTILREKCRAFDGRVRGIAAVALQKPDEAAKELRRAIKDLGLVGGVVTGTVGKRNLDDPYFEPFFREANELGAASRRALDHRMLR